MKKGKLLALALAAGITFMGAGYAAWSDNVNINATVKTGKLEVEMIQDGSSALITEPKNQSVATADVTAGNENTTITFEKLYPGAKGEANVKVVNRSTIPVKFQRTNIDLGGGEWDAAKGVYKKGELEFKVKIEVNNESKWVDNTFEEIMIAPEVKSFNIIFEAELPFEATGTKGETLEFKLNTKVVQFNQ